ncbi:hypothetical protein U9M48_023031 [Paspalum notatum var. saurae]|uniref:Uncharacterized protein n=1 Tax=Paspalum notatum var. saurae TaxID=547442 RepID=A0AAQ3WVR3_PASNO
MQDFTGRTPGLPLLLIDDQLSVTIITIRLRTPELLYWSKTVMDRADTSGFVSGGSNGTSLLLIFFHFVYSTVHI